MKEFYACTIMFVLLVCPTLSPVEALASSNSVQEPQKKLLGKLSKGEYSFPGGELKIKIPPLLEPGAKIRDEKADDVTQVILTDDIGTFYRVVVLDNARGEYDVDAVLNVFKGIRERETITTTRGKELRVVDLEKEGAELTITTMKKGEDGQTKVEQRVPDLLTANAVFASGKTIIHVVAGVAVIHADKVDMQVSKVKEQLDKFLSGIEITGDKK